ncbi:MAG: radical SAM protein [Deltaproteobacteria bacterium]|nr:radical SAM protein [Deltaproteobacteria bacterium]
MPLIEPIIRPPAEADSLLLQITTGCSANTCTFCPAYIGKPFKLIDSEVVYNDIRAAAKRFPETRKIFLLDGDVLVLSNTRLMPILELINESFPHLSRIASYANGQNIEAKSDEDLAQLVSLKLNLIYIGLESGSQEILTKCNKRATVEQMITAVNRAAAVGIKSSVMLLLGLGGKEHSAEHVEQSIIALNKMQPRYLSFLSLMLVEGTPLFDDLESGVFEELGSNELLQESHDIIQGLELNKTIFRSNHASNYLSLEGRFPKDKALLLAQLRAGLEGKLHLRPEFFRGL